MMKVLQKRKTKQKCIIIGCWLMIAILSMSLFSNLFSAPSFHKESLEKLDEMKSRALLVSTAVTLTSTLITTAPDDMGTPLADQLAELSSVLFVCTCIIFLEKYLLSFMSFLSFSILVPLACFIGIVHALKPDKVHRRWIAKLLVLAIVFIGVVPCGVKLVGFMEGVFAETISNTFEPISKLIEDIQTVSNETKDVFSFFNNVKEAATAFFDTLQNILTILIDGVALLLVSVAFIPLVTVILFVFIVKKIFGVDAAIPDIKLHIAARRLKTTNKENELN